MVLKARVVDGRFVIDEPTGLPDGTELFLTVIESSDGIDEAERSELLQSIEDGAEDFEKGHTEDGLAFSRRLIAQS